MSPRPAAASADPARRAAADLLLAVDRDDAYANLLLPRLLRERGLSGQDAAFATELGYGALRRGGCLDAVIATGARRDTASLDPAVRAVLRVGAYQLLHTRVPQHAAVATSVDLCRELAGPRPAGLVNAVLRRVAEHDWEQWVERLAPRDDPLGRRAFAAGYPRWIAAAWRDALGGSEPDVELALAADRPAVHLAARPGRISRDELLDQAGAGATAGPWSPYAVRLAGGDPAAIPAVRDGRAAVQDEGSQLVALAARRAPVDGRDERWLDVCAGPGGKSALLAGLLPAGGRLVAAELHPHRARLVRRVLAGEAAGVLIADSTRPPWRSAAFDRVLLDAPCTGLGALRRRPEARWRRSSTDVERLQPLQSALLDAALDAARPGGIVTYATCSPHPGETVAVIEAARQRRDDLELVDARPYVGDLPSLGDGPFVQLWPHRHGTDAMFVAIVRHAE